jgi:CspA family cold shock protein
MDESTAIHPSQLPQRTHVLVASESNRQRARMKWFNRLRGFGFLTCGDGTELRPDQVVLVRYGRGPNGLMAADIRPDKNSGQSLSDTH